MFRILQKCQSVIQNFIFFDVKTNRFCWCANFLKKTVKVRGSDKIKVGNNTDVIDSLRSRKIQESKVPDASCGQSNLRLLSPRCSIFHCRCDSKGRTWLSPASANLSAHSYASHNSAESSLSHNDDNCFLLSPYILARIKSAGTVMNVANSGDKK